MSLLTIKDLSKIKDIRRHTQCIIRMNVLSPLPYYIDNHVYYKLWWNLQSEISIKIQNEIIIKNQLNLYKI